jgi:hypothetical protein
MPSITETTISSSKRVLEPHDRISEVLFGLIMVLTFTGSLSIAEAGREDIRTMLIGAIGCNLAWGIIDGVFYLMGCLAEKGQYLLALRSLRGTNDPAKAKKLIASVMPSMVASVLRAEEFAAIDKRLKEVPEPPQRAPLSAQDWRGAIAVFLIVFLCTFPVALPFVFMENARHALRISNAVAVAMLFMAGLAYGRAIGRASWIIGLSMVVLGAMLVGITIALGG